MLSLFDFPERFHSKVMPVTESGCWLWMAGLTSDGYGSYSFDGKKSGLAHRYSCRAAHGDIPREMEVDHLCRVRSCVNPDHLEVVTHRTNMIRSPATELAKVWAASITHCPHGHPYTEGNTYKHGNHRYCRECQRVKTRRLYRENREARLEWQRKHRAKKKLLAKVL